MVEYLKVYYIRLDIVYLVSKLSKFISNSNISRRVIVLNNFMRLPFKLTILSFMIQF
jgi:hypothetical protein